MRNACVGRSGDGADWLSCVQEETPEASEHETRDASQREAEDAYRILWAQLAVAQRPELSEFWAAAAMADSYYAGRSEEREHPTSVFSQLMGEVELAGVAAQEPCATAGRSGVGVGPIDQARKEPRREKVVTPRAEDEGHRHMTVAFPDDGGQRLPGGGGGGGSLCCCRFTGVKWTFEKDPLHNPGGGKGGALYFEAHLKITFSWEWVGAPLFAPCSLKLHERSTVAYDVHFRDTGELANTVPGGAAPGKFGRWVDLSGLMAHESGWKSKMLDKTPEDCPDLINTSDSIEDEDKPHTHTSRRLQIRWTFRSGCGKTGARKHGQLIFQQTAIFGGRHQGQYQWPPSGEIPSDRHPWPGVLPPPRSGTRPPPPQGRPGVHPAPPRPNPSPWR